MCTTKTLSICESFQWTGLTPSGCQKATRAESNHIKRKPVFDMKWHSMGWLQLVGSLKIQVSFAKEPYKKNCILPKRPIILRSLLIVANTYQDYLNCMRLVSQSAIPSSPSSRHYELSAVSHSYYFSLPKNRYSLFPGR